MADRETTAVILATRSEQPKSEQSGRTQEFGRDEQPESVGRLEAWRRNEWNAGQRKQRRWNGWFRPGASAAKNPSQQGTGSGGSTQKPGTGNPGTGNPSNR
jgi:hypothetical protein